MSENPKTTIENGHVHVDDDALQSSSAHAPLDPQHVKKVLIKKRIQGMSKTKKILGLVGLLLLLAASGYGINKWLGSTSEITYSTATIGQGTVTDLIEATGTLEAVRESAMGFKNDDIITALNVQPGDHVSAGQILAEQDPASLNTALQQAQNTVNKDQISLKSSQLTYQTNLKTMSQQQQLFAAGAISQDDLDTAQNSLSKSEWDLELAQANLASDQLKLAQAQEDLAEATILAPFAGIIGAVNGQVGQINGINTSASTLLTVMSDELQLSSLVNEADIGRIKVGQGVEFTSSSFADKLFTGTVLRITPQASTVSNVQYYPVLISVNDPTGVLLSGMSVSASIIVARQSDVLMVPMMAVSYAQTYLKSNPNLAPSGSGKAVVVMENNQPVVKAVTLGISDGSNYVVSEGLSAGEQVIVGTNQTTTSNTASSSSRNQNQGGNIGGGPPGF